mmetsp:Transcript_17990/g.29791  ORF Transcript_17990/g.29791 Transcript_17990/m.29791 type:complete len:118 (-) Transcript_17990:1051-1404(-)
MSDINPDTGESMGSSRSPRFTMWAAFLIFSAITLGGAVEEVRFCFERSIFESFSLRGFYVDPWYWTKDENRVRHHYCSNQTFHNDYICPCSRHYRRRYRRRRAGLNMSHNELTICFQ